MRGGPGEPAFPRAKESRWSLAKSARRTIRTTRAAAVEPVEVRVPTHKASIRSGQSLRRPNGEASPRSLSPSRAHPRGTPPLAEPGRSPDRPEPGPATRRPPSPRVRRGSGSESTVNARMSPQAIWCPSASTTVPSGPTTVVGWSRWPTTSSDPLSSKRIGRWPSPSRRTWDRAVRYQEAPASSGRWMRSSLRKVTCRAPRPLRTRRSPGSARVGAPRCVRSPGTCSVPPWRVYRPRPSPRRSR